MSHDLISGVYTVSTYRITKSRVDALSPPASGQIFVRDAELKGFAVRVTASGTRSFIVEKRIAGRLRRFTLAKYPELTVEQARKLAQAQLGKIASGVDPIAERNAMRKDRVTLSHVFADFKIVRHNLSPKTLSLYTWAHDSCLADWRSRALSDITKDQVFKKHHELAEQRGKTTANFALAFLSSMYSFAIQHYEDAHGQPILVRNPVDAIRHNRAWYPKERRQTVITPDQLPAWYAGVQQLRDSGKARDATVADYLLLLLFTGLRRNEALALKVGDIDLQRRTLRVERTKNGKPLVLPLSSYLLTHLERVVEGRPRDADLFTTPSGKGFLAECYRQKKKIAEQSGVRFSLHDLRRTFITIAERQDISMLAIKRLVNHASSDVTAGYVVMDIERLRGPMEQISTTLLRHIAGEGSAQILNFGTA